MKRTKKGRVLITLGRTCKLSSNILDTRAFLFKKADHMLLKTSYFVPIAIDYLQTLLKCVPKINKQLLKTACAKCAFENI